MKSLEDNYLKITHGRFPANVFVCSTFQSRGSGVGSKFSRYKNIWFQVVSEKSETKYQLRKAKLPHARFCLWEGVCGVQLEMLAPCRSILDLRRFSTNPTQKSFPFSALKEPGTAFTVAAMVFGLLFLLVFLLRAVDYFSNEIWTAEHSEICTTQWVFSVSLRDHHGSPVQSRTNGIDSGSPFSV